MQYTQQIDTLAKKLKDMVMERDTLICTLKETESKYQKQISALQDRYQISDSSKTVASLKEKVATMEVK